MKDGISNISYTYAKRNLTLLRKRQRSFYDEIMPTVLDQRIDEWSARLADLRRRAAEIEREASVVEIRLETFIEARSLIQGDATALAGSSGTPQDLPLTDRQPLNVDGSPSGRPSRLSVQWRSLIAFALARYPALVTNNEFSEEAKYASGEGRLVRGAVDDRDCAYEQPYAQSPA